MPNKTFSIVNLYKKKYSQYQKQKEINNYYGVEIEKISKFQLREIVMLSKDALAETSGKSLIEQRGKIGMVENIHTVDSNITELHYFIKFFDGDLRWFVAEEDLEKVPLDLADSQFDLWELYHSEEHAMERQEKINQNVDYDVFQKSIYKFGEIISISKDVKNETTGAPIEDYKFRLGQIENVRPNGKKTNELDYRIKFLDKLDRWFISEQDIVQEKNLNHNQVTLSKTGIKIQEITQSNSQALVSFVLDSRHLINEIFLREVNGKIQTIALDFSSEGNNITFDINQVAHLISDDDFRFVFLASYQNEVGEVLLSKVRLRGQNKKKIFKYLNDFKIIPESFRNFQIYWNNDGFLSAQHQSAIKNFEQYGLKREVVKVDDIDLKDNKITFTLSCKLFYAYMNKNVASITFSKLSLIKTINEQDQLKLQITDLKPDKIIAEIELSKIFEMERYGAYYFILEFYINTIRFEFKVTKVTNHLKRILMKKRKMISEKDRTLFFPNHHKGDFNLFISDKIYLDKPWRICLEVLISKLYGSQLLVSKRKNKILIFEKYTQYAQDNGFALFEWIQKNVPNNNVYYVIERQSKAFDKLIIYKHRVIITGSIAYYWHIATSDMLASSDTQFHLFGEVNRRTTSPFFHSVISNKPMFFLQHGVTALKKHEGNPWLLAKSGKITVFNVTNKVEQEAVHQYMGYDMHQLPILGFARWDYFSNQTAEELSYLGSILYVPTWRQWLNNMTDEEFIQSNYYKAITSLTCHPKLKEMLEQRNRIFYVYLHPFMQKFTHLFTEGNEYIQFLSSDEYDLGVLLRGSSLLITDYSSVAWDFAVQEKPVIFYQFDQEKYLEKIGAMIDLDDIPIGKTIKSESDIIFELNSYFEQGLVLEPVFAEKIESIFGEKKENYSSGIYQNICDTMTQINSISPRKTIFLVRFLKFLTRVVKKYLRIIKIAK